MRGKRKNNSEMIRNLLSHYDDCMYSFNQEYEFYFLRLCIPTALWLLRLYFDAIINPFRKNLTGEYGLPEIRNKYYYQIMRTLNNR